LPLQLKSSTHAITHTPKSSAGGHSPGFFAGFIAISIPFKYFTEVAFGVFIQFNYFKIICILLDIPKVVCKLKQAMNTMKKFIFPISQEKCCEFLFFILSFAYQTN
jgi:hypothetical protein